MSAVSQSYPKYLGGLNEQPDELKKPGQLVEALNVIPDPTIGLSRRPGFRLIPQSKVFKGELNVNPDPLGTWFEIELSNQINNDYIYFGNIRRDGGIVIYNQDGVKQAIRYTEDDEAIEPHKKYLYNNDRLDIFNDNGDRINSIPTTATSNNGYFKHQNQNPLKYCVSKGHVIFTNPTEYPTLTKGKVASDNDKRKYYSFVSLKLIDTANYNYIFKVFGPKTQEPELTTYRYITDIETIKVDNILDDYDRDTTLPLQVNGPFRFSITPRNGGADAENAIIEVTFVGQVVQLKSSDGDGFRNEARYTWSTQIIYPGKGFKKGDKYKETKTSQELGGPTDLEFTFQIQDTKTVTEVENQNILPTLDPSDNISDLDATDIIANLRTNFQANPNITSATIVGNGIYLESNSEFSVSTTETAVADVMNSQKMENDEVPIVRVNTVSELPVECFAGFIVEVINSFDGTNNYYLEYIAESETIINNEVTKSDGYWEEIAKPYEPISIRNGTMPHMITVVRESDQERFIFVVSPIKFVKRTAGTSLDNPSMFTDNARITCLNYYKNRLFFMTSNGTVISSRAGEIDNLFLNTALRTSPIDPIDVVANSNQRVPIHGSSIVNNGMVLFGDSEQYMMTTNADILTSETANVTKVANYTFDYRSSPIYLGANLGFVSSGLTRFYEMTNLYDRGPVDINERSQQIQARFGNNFNMPVSSREQSQVVVYKSSENASTNMLIYRFRQESSQESSQTSWVRWRVDRPIAYVSMPRDKMFVFVHSTQNGCDIYRMDGSSVEGLPANSLSTVPKFTDGYTDAEDGVKFKSIIKFPVIYAQTKDKMDVNANLTIHRVKLSTGPIGTYDLKIERKGYDTYRLLVEQTPADEYMSEFPTLYGEKIETIPIYTRNKNLTLTMSTDYDAPMTLRSMTWEGDYNRPYYKSV
jgi:hypothetical protein